MIKRRTRRVDITMATAARPVGAGDGVAVAGVGTDAITGQASPALAQPEGARVIDTDVGTEGSYEEVAVTTARVGAMLRRFFVLSMATTALAVAVWPAAACGKGTPAGDPTTPPTSAGAAPPADGAIPAGSAAPVAGVYAPTIDPGAFSTTVDNPFFPLRPGMRWEYRSTTADGLETTVVTVTNNTKTIMGIPCVEVHDTVKLNGQLKEDTLDWYAQHRDGTVWYFGEDTKEYEDGKAISAEGSWTAGASGAQPGIIMPAQPQTGERYRQEYKKGEAEDMAEVLSLAEKATVPTGSYDAMLKTKETTPLEPKLLEHKYYARGVGMVLTTDVAAGGRDELVQFTG
jgi:hypothetical protein